MKSSTDIHWDEQAVNVTEDLHVNIHDVFQRELEHEFILKHLNSNDNVLEVGCGNGFSTNIFRQHVAHIDAFDYSEEMIGRAKESFGESNNCFFRDNLLEPKFISKQYDVIICLRVLINLRDIDEQFQALNNLNQYLKKGGKFILIEGYIDGFVALNIARKELHIPPIIPAKINFYSSFEKIQSFLNNSYQTSIEFHTGFYDYLTRIVYPKLVGNENVKTNSDFAEKFFQLAKNHNPDLYQPYARLKGLICLK